MFYSKISQGLLTFMFLSLCNAQAQEITQIPTGTDIYTLSYMLSLADSSITFEVTAQGKGWVGFGFSNVSGMVSSDIFIAGVNDDSSTYSGDYSSVTVGRPALDEVQDWELLEATETDSTTFVKFKRSLETTDEKDINITSSLMNVIWAIGPGDDLIYHAFQRSSLVFNLITGSNEGNAPEPPPIPPTTTSVPPTTSPTPINSIPLNSDLIDVFYSISGDTITFTAIGKTKGYLGLGFSNRTGMSDADFIVVGVNDDDGEAYFGDYHTFSFGNPTPDIQQDWELVSATQTEDETIAVFSRLLNTNDYLQDVPIEDKEMVIIWAVGSTDALEYHENRGQITFNLMNTLNNIDYSENI